MRRLLQPHVPRRVIAVAALAIVALAIAAGTVLADGHWFTSDNPWPYQRHDARAGARSRRRHLMPAGRAGRGGEEDGHLRPGTRLNRPRRGAERDRRAGRGDEAGARRGARRRAVPERLLLGLRELVRQVLGRVQVPPAPLAGQPRVLRQPRPDGRPRHLATSTTTTGSRTTPTAREIDQTVTNPTTGHVVAQPAPQPDGQAGPFGQTGNGWYSYNLGAWHLISLNVECADEPGGCNPTGPGSRARPSGWRTTSTRTTAAARSPTGTSRRSAPRSRRRPCDSDEGQAADAWWKLLYAHHADADPQRPRSRLLAVRADGSGRQRRPAARDPRVHHRHGRRVARHGSAEPRRTSRRTTDQYYGVMKFTLRSRRLHAGTTSQR